MNKLLTLKNQAFQKYLDSTQTPNPSLTISQVPGAKSTWEFTKADDNSNLFKISNPSSGGTLVSPDIFTVELVNSDGPMDNSTWLIVPVKNVGNAIRIRRNDLFLTLDLTSDTLFLDALYLDERANEQIWIYKLEEN